MQLDLISPNNGDVLLAHTLDLPTLGSLRADGVDLAALLPSAHIARTWDPGVTEALSIALDKLLKPILSSFVEPSPIRKREIDMTAEERRNIPVPHTLLTIDGFTTYEYVDQVLSPSFPPIVSKKRDALVSLLAFFKRGEEEHLLLRNDLYAEASVEEIQPIEEVPPGAEEEVNEEVVQSSTH